jgi:hypothetical protein
MKRVELQTKQEKTSFQIADLCFIDTITVQILSQLWYVLTKCKKRFFVETESIKNNATIWRSSIGKSLMKRFLHFSACTFNSPTHPSAKNSTKRLFFIFHFIIWTPTAKQKDKNWKVNTCVNISFTFLHKKKLTKNEDIYINNVHSVERIQHINEK